MTVSIDISVIITTHNRANLLSKAINSILNQTYSNFEVIIVDDASTDNTKEIIEKFNDKRIRYIRHNINRGCASARNTGISISRGKWVAFLDDDDEWVPSKLEKQIAVFSSAQSNIGVVYTDIGCEKNSRRSAYRPIVKRDGDVYISLLRQQLLSVFPSTSIVKRECFDRVGCFDETMLCCEDLDMFIRIAKLYHFKYINEPLVIMYDTPSSLSTNVENYARAFIKIFKKCQNENDLDKITVAIFNRNIGHMLCLAGKYDEGRKYLRSGLKANFLDLRLYLAIALAFLCPKGYVLIYSIYDKMMQSIIKIVYKCTNFTGCYLMEML